MKSLATIPSFNDAPSLCAYLKRAGIFECSGVVALDGYNGVGKSSTARTMAAELGIPAVHGDAFVWERGTRLYPHLLDLETLKRTLQSHMCAGAPVILDTVHALSVLEALGLSPIVHLYIKHYWPASVPTHAGLFSPGRTLTARIAEEVSEHRLQGRDPDEDPTLFLELLRYHRSFKPLCRRTIELHVAFKPG